MTIIVWLVCFNKETESKIIGPVEAVGSAIGLIPGGVLPKNGSFTAPIAYTQGNRVVVPVSE